ncbi:MAG: serine hydrolase domain-containing protein [Candidatus Hermodarchaeota archaeon]
MNITSEVTTWGMIMFNSERRRVVLEKRMTIVESKIGKTLISISISILLVSLILPLQAYGYSNSSSYLVTSSYDPDIDSLIVEIMRENHIPSLATALIRDNNIIWAKGYGEQPEIDTVYMIGSITKTFTTIALLQLYEQSYFDLDDDVNDYLPFTLRNPLYPNIPITFRMLLSHTSSLGGYTENLELHTYSDGLERVGLEEMIPEWPSYPDWFREYFLPNGSVYEASVWTTYEPGTRWNYSNVGFTLLAYLLEIMTDQLVNQYVEENILVPLGMDNTGYNFSDIEDINKLATPYAFKWDDDPNTTGNTAYPHYNFLGKGSGGMRSNILDLARYSLLFSHAGVSNGTRILSEESVNLITQDYLGWLDFGPNWDGHGGDIFGFISHMIINLGRGTLVPYEVIVFTNQWYSLDANLNLTYTISDIVYEIDKNLYLFTNSSSNTTAAPGFTIIWIVCFLLISSIYFKKIRKCKPV